jgi:nucleoside-diphosphate-sugar epimerase
MLMQSARQNGCVRFIGTGENRWTLVHVDDLADLYVRALEKAPAGTSLIAASDLIVRVREVAEALSQALGIPGQIEALPIEQARQTLGLYADALALDQQVSGAKAMELLGWKPKALSLFEELRRLS